MSQFLIEQAFDLALRHHQAERFREAEQLYRQILDEQPQHYRAMHYLGMIAHQAGRNEMAVDLIRRAIALSPDYAGAYNNLGNVLKDRGQLDEAIAAYRQAIAHNCKLAEAHNNLGSALKDKGELDTAVSACRQAILIRPNYSEAYINLGNALKEIGRIDEAVTAYREAIALDGKLFEAYVNLGGALTDKGQFDEAIGACRQAIAIRPDSAEAHSNLGAALKGKGRLDEAIAACRQAIAMRPNSAVAHSNLGAALKGKGQLDEAIAAYHQAIAIRPSFAEAHFSLGNLLNDKGRFEEAIAAYGRAVNTKPDFAEAYNNLGIALKEKGEVDEAINAYHKAIRLNPGFAKAFSNLGLALIDIGQLDEAITAHRQAVDLEPGNAAIDSNLVGTLNFHPGYDAQAIAEEHRRWNQQHAEPLRKIIQAYSNDRSPERRLRIGYVSPDFRDHVIGRNLLPLFQQHDHRQFEIICYAQVHIPDPMTSRIQQHADCWRNILGLSDEDVTKQIREDRIDVLADLTLHLAHNRLLVFARKPAPVQLTFAGYPGSTGLSAIDYRLSDPYLDPPSMNESVYSEQTIRLADTFWCYDPLEGREIPVNSLPALEKGVVTFGCLNNFCKVNDAILALWGQVLLQVEGSRLLLLAQHGSHRQRTRDRFSKEGIDPERIEFIPRQARPEYLEQYHRIDLGLDSFPYNGHTTSLDSFWMGVPVVTLVGQTAVSRAGWSQVSNLGLKELAGQTDQQFVRIAVELAMDLVRLKNLRSTLRRRMEQSPLMDAPKFTRSIEAAYRQMWHTWCGTGS